jgi:flagellar basal body-associated protein FliL
MKTNINVMQIIVILLVLAAGGAYWYFSAGSQEQPTLTELGSGNRLQNEFQTLAGQLTPITFNTSIFSDARFTALVDITTPITQEPVGRSDPFSAVVAASEI